MVESKKPDDMDGATRHKLTLSSHPGKAIVKRNVKEQDIRFSFELGDRKNAVEVEVSKNFPDGQLIKLADQAFGFDCASYKYHDQNEVITWNHHK